MGACGDDERDDDGSIEDDQSRGDALNQANTDEKPQRICPVTAITRRSRPLWLWLKRCARTVMIGGLPPTN